MVFQSYVVIYTRSHYTIDVIGGALLALVLLLTFKDGPKQPYSVSQITQTEDACEFNESAIRECDTERVDESNDSFVNYAPVAKASFVDNHSTQTPNNGP